MLVGRLKEAMGRNADALASYHSAAASYDRRAAAQGRLREILLRYTTGDMTAQDATGALETLTTIWRGDDVEPEGLKLLAHLYTVDNRYRAAFHVMRTALLAYPDSESTRADSGRGAHQLRQPVPRRQSRRACRRSRRSACSTTIATSPRSDSAATR